MMWYRVGYERCSVSIALREREVPPRFAQLNTLEFAIASRWKQAYDDEKVQRDEFEQRLKLNRNEIQKEMEVIKEQHRTDLLRQELARHQEAGLRLAEQLRQRGVSDPAMGGYHSLAPPGAAVPPPTGLLQQPPGQQIPAPLFPTPGSEVSLDGRVRIKLHLHVYGLWRALFGETDSHLRFRGVGVAM